MKRASFPSTLIIWFIVATLQLSVATTAVGETVYKKVGENGSLIFSDEPFEGAEAIDIQPVSTINLHVNTTSTAPPPAPRSRPETITYETLQVTSPLHDSTLLNTAGVGAVNVSSTPNLGDHHLYRLLLNGENKGTQTKASFPLTGLNRGAYTAVVQIVKGSGEVIKVSSPVTFYVRQHSIRH
ncbi:MAG: hypothetical protein COA99_13360 [Moraxellaceae bacterium]|nr:MAG: hypothetical protein COA99_13360 [Moraxellaceae bacterium]